jgi:hypothetical protein
MNEKPASAPAPVKAISRPSDEEKRAQALRENLLKRKMQSQSREGKTGHVRQNEDR